MKVLFSLLTALLPLTSASCYHGTSLSRRAQDQASEAPSFGYGPENGPLLWHTLKTPIAGANALCAHGRHQSPIDVRNYAKGDDDGNTPPFVRGASLDFRVQDLLHGGTLTNLGTTLEIGEVEGGLIVDGRRYKLVQFHFHTPSEHRLDGEHFPLETHFVFEGEDASLAVVGIFIELTSSSHRHRATRDDPPPSPLLTSVFSSIPEHRGNSTETPPLKFSSLERHVAQSRVARYDGSLTTPPCSEGVKWHIVEETIFLDVGTYRRVKKVLGFNSRYTQNVPGGENLLVLAGEGL